ncbi:hypothetical protein GCM10009850_100480 [Nonomuraea monospora]|uniref:Novel STAND NTPase 1 domain-containing protein n=1 Tax=Nonomuraea monospora TaxID=568818 RepID=A0ABN3CZ89_9ACTN
MNRRRIKLVVNILLVLFGALLGLVANYTTNDPDPGPLRLLQEWSFPLLVTVVVLLVAGQVWLHTLDRPATIVRKWDPSGKPPYPGLEAFTEADAGVFFGRDEEIRDLAARFQPPVAHRFVLVLGPSGSGKSSLVRAGLLPALQRRRERWVVVPPFTPGADPVAGLAHGLAAALPGMSEQAVRSELAGGVTGLRWCVQRARGANLLVVIDQLEELPADTAFLELIAGALAAEPRLWVVATLRSDFLTAFLEAGHAGLLREPMTVGALGRAELREVIEKPGERAGLSFAPGVVSRMVDDTGGGDALPLLAYTLQELFLKAGPGGTVTEDDYLRLGGVSGALSAQADRITAALGGADAVVPTLLRFVSLEGAEPTRRRVRRQDVGGGELAVVDAFVAGRLLVSDGDMLDVAHETLFRQWPPLRRAVEADAERLRRRSELERWAREWEQSGRQDAYLLSGQRLSLVRTGVIGSVTPLGEEFLEGSRRQERATMERVADAAARRVIERAGRDSEVAILAGLAVVEECAPTTAARQALQTALSVSRVLAVLRGHDSGVRGVAWSPDGSLLASAGDDGTVRIWNVRGEAGPIVLADGDDPLWSVAWSPCGRWLAAGSWGRPATVWSTGTWAVYGVLPGVSGGATAWSPDGERLATAALDGTVQIWDVQALAPLMTLNADYRTFRDLAWSPDGRRLAAAADAEGVWCWDLDQPFLPVEPTIGTGSAMSLSWSPDGLMLASTEAAETVVIRDGAHGQRLTGILLGPRRMPCLTWAQAGTRLAAGDDHGDVHIWWDADFSVHTPLVGHAETVDDIAWHGDTIATASRDRTVTLWDATPRGGSGTTLAGHTGTITAVAWSPDGHHLAIVQQVHPMIWDIEGARPVLTTQGWEQYGPACAWSPDGGRVLMGAVVCDLLGSDQMGWFPFHPGESAWLEDDAVQHHLHNLTAVAWSPDGLRVATASLDQNIHLWAAGNGAHLAKFPGHGDEAGDVCWSPDSRYLATSSNRAEVVIRDTLNMTVEATLKGHRDHTWSIDWARDGRIATGSRDQSIRVWDPRTGAELAVATGHEGRVSAVAWSPDGRSLASTSWDGTVRLWNPDGGHESAVIGVHDDHVNSLSWHPDGTRLATGSSDRTVRIWEVHDPASDLEELLARARARVFRPLTDDERRAFLLPPTSAARSRPA